jgi:hypothetical protein
MRVGSREAGGPGSDRQGHRHPVGLIDVVGVDEPLRSLLIILFGFRAGKIDFG